MLRRRRLLLRCMMGHRQLERQRRQVVGVVVGMGRLELEPRRRPAWEVEVEVGRRRVVLVQVLPGCRQALGEGVAEERSGPGLAWGRRRQLAERPQVAASTRSSDIRLVRHKAAPDHKRRTSDRPA